MTGTSLANSCRQGRSLTSGIAILLVGWSARWFRRHRRRPASCPKARSGRSRRCGHRGRCRHRSAWCRGPISHPPICADFGHRPRWPAAATCSSTTITRQFRTAFLPPTRFTASSAPAQVISNCSRAGMSRRDRCTASTRRERRPPMMLVFPPSRPCCPIFPPAIPGRAVLPPAIFPTVAAIFWSASRATSPAIPRQPAGCRLPPTCCGRSG